MCCDGIEDSSHLTSGERAVGVHREAFPGEHINDGERAELPAVHEAVLHEVHAPPLVGTRWRRGDDAQMTPSLLPLLRPHPESLELVEAVHALDIDLPALAAQKDVE